MGSETTPYQPKRPRQVRVCMLRPMEPCEVTNGVSSDCDINSGDHSPGDPWTFAWQPSSDCPRGQFCFPCSEVDANGVWSITGTVIDVGGGNLGVDWGCPYITDDPVIDGLANLTGYYQLDGVCYPVVVGLCSGGDESFEITGHLEPVFAMKKVQEGQAAEYFDCTTGEPLNVEGWQECAPGQTNGIGGPLALTKKPAFDEVEEEEPEGNCWTITFENVSQRALLNPDNVFTWGGVTGNLDALTAAIEEMGGTLEVITIFNDEGQEIADIKDICICVPCKGFDTPPSNTLEWSFLSGSRTGHWTKKDCTEGTQFLYTEELCFHGFEYFYDNTTPSNGACGFVSANYGLNPNETEWVSFENFCDNFDPFAGHVNTAANLNGYFDDMNDYLTANTPDEWVWSLDVPNRCWRYFTTISKDQCYGKWTLLYRGNTVQVVPRVKYANCKLTRKVCETKDSANNVTTQSIQYFDAKDQPIADLRQWLKDCTGFNPLTIDKVFAEEDDVLECLTTDCTPREVRQIEDNNTYGTSNVCAGADGSGEALTIFWTINGDGQYSQEVYTTASLDLDPTEWIEWTEEFANCDGSPFTPEEQGECDNAQAVKICPIKELTTETLSYCGFLDGDLTNCGDGNVVEFIRVFQNCIEDGLLVDRTFTDFELDGVTPFDSSSFTADTVSIECRRDDAGNLLICHETCYTYSPPVIVKPVRPVKSVATLSASIRTLTATAIKTLIPIRERVARAISSNAEVIPPSPYVRGTCLKVVECCPCGDTENIVSQEFFIQTPSETEFSEVTPFTVNANWVEKPCDPALDCPTEELVDLGPCTIAAIAPPVVECVDPCAESATRLTLGRPLNTVPWSYGDVSGNTFEEFTTAWEAQGGKAYITNQNGTGDGTGSLEAHWICPAIDGAVVMADGQPIEAPLTLMPNPMAEELGCGPRDATLTVGCNDDKIANLLEQLLAKQCETNELLADSLCIDKPDEGEGDEGEGKPTLPEAGRKLVSDNSQDGGGNAPFNLQVRNASNAAVNWEAFLDSVPYQTIPNLNLPAGVTHAVTANGDGTFNHLFSGSNLAGFQNVTITGGVPSPPGTNQAPQLFCEVA